MSTDRDHRVAVLVLDGAKALDVGIAAHVFAKRPSMPYEVRVCAEHAGTVDGGNGLAYAVSHDLDTLTWADTILVPGYRNPADVTTPLPVIAALRAAHERGTRIAAISTGAQIEKDQTSSKRSPHAGRRHPRRDQARPRCT